jgi:surface protein
MFHNQGKIKKLNLSSFNTTKANDDAFTGENGIKEPAMRSVFDGMNSLEEITLGANFSFNGDGTTQKPAVLPTPNPSYIDDADGKWYALDLTTYAPADIPNKTANTYYASFLLTRDVDVLIKNGTLIDIATSVRGKNDMNTKYRPSEISGAIDELPIGSESYKEGIQAAYDEFWDAYQYNGNRTDCANCFSGRGWNYTTFKPKYDIYTTNAYMLFRYTGITDLGKALNGKKVIINTDTLQYTFNTTLLEVIDGVEYKKPIKKLDGTFHYSGKLREIRNPIPIDSAATSLNAFSDCKALEEIRFSGVIPVSISFKSCTKLSKASIENAINTLSTTATGQTITLSKAAINKAFETSEGTNDGSTSTEWTTLTNTKTNWTISLV